MTGASLVALWGEPTHRTAHWEAFFFDAGERSSRSGETVQLGATHRGPSYDLVSIHVGREVVFVSPEDAERFASAILTVSAKARNHIHYSSKENP